MRQPDLVFARLRLETPFAHAIEHVVARDGLRWRAGDVAARRECSRMRGRTRRIRSPRDTSLESTLSHGGASTVPDDLLRARRRRGEKEGGGGCDVADDATPPERALSPLHDRADR